MTFCCSCFSHISPHTSICCMAPKHISLAHQIHRDTLLLWQLNLVCHIKLRLGTSTLWCLLLGTSTLWCLWLGTTTCGLKQQFAAWHINLSTGTTMCGLAYQFTVWHIPLWTGKVTCDHLAHELVATWHINLCSVTLTSCNCSTTSLDVLYVHNAFNILLKNHTYVIFIV
jgi:hypothetical protein